MKLTPSFLRTFSWSIHTWLSSVRECDMHVGQAWFTGYKGRNNITVSKTASDTASASSTCRPPEHCMYKTKNEAHTFETCDPHWKIQAKKKVIVQSTTVPIVM